MMEKFYLVIQYAASPVENIIIIYYLIKNFGFKDNRMIRKLQTVLMLIVAVVMGQFTQIIPNGNVVMTVAVIGVFWGYCRISLKGKALMQLLCCLTVFIMLVLTTTLSLQIISSTVKVDVGNVLKNKDSVLIGVFLLSKVLLYIGVETLLYLFNRNELHLRKKEWITLIFMFVVSIIISLNIYILMTMVQGEDGLNLQLFMILIGIFVLNIYIYHSILRISRDNQNILKSELADLQRKEMANQLLQISESYDNEARLYHDYKNHLMCMQELLQDEKYSEALKYTQNVTKNYIVNRITQKVCNNAMINSVVNSKIRVCQKKGIIWEHHVTGDISNLGGVECSIIIFNLLDNAIEALSKIKKDENKKLVLEMYFNKSYFNIVVKNFIKESVLIKNPNLLSSKINGKHGLGHVNVKEVVDRNGGMVDYYENNNEFVAHVMLKV